MTKARIGIIGCGGIANGKHLAKPFQSKRGRNRLLSVTSLLRRQKKQKKNTELKIPKYIQVIMNCLLMHPSMSFTYVRRNDSHAEISIAALEAGKHVLCEKPMAKTAADARLMLEASKRTGQED